MSGDVPSLAVPQVGPPSWPVRLRSTVEVLRYATISAWADIRTSYSWTSWSLGWIGRVIAQVIFFALIGVLIDSREAVRFLLVGNAVMIAAIESMTSVQSTTWERRTGTLGLLVAAPGSPLTVFAGRSIGWAGSGLMSAIVGFFTVAAIFRVDLPWPRALLLPVLILSVCVGAYLFGLFLGALVLRAMEARNIVMNTTYLIMMTICGVNVPVDFWPQPIQVLAWILPVTHGLGAVRALLDGGPTSQVALGAGLEVLVGVGWLTLALLSIRRLVERGRRDGSIELSL
jgi:ABC-2 type transport system permease protein